MKGTQNVKYVPTRAWAAITALALSSALLVAPDNTGLIPEAQAGITCTTPAAPLTAAKAQGSITTPGKWRQKVIASTDKAEVFPGDTFTYRIQVESTYNWTAFERLAISLPEGFSVEGISNPYPGVSVEYCGFEDLTNAAYPQYDGATDRVWSVKTNARGVGDGEFRQVDVKIKVADNAPVGTSTPIGIGLQAGPVIGELESAENSSFGPTIQVNERLASMELRGDSVISTTGEATITALVSPMQATGRVAFSIAGQDKETLVDVLDGQAVWKTPSPDGNDFVVNARFIPTNGFTNTQAESFPVRVVAAATSVTLEHPSQVAAEQPVTLSATVSPRNAKGKILFTWTTNNGSRTTTQEVVPGELGKANFRVEFPTNGVEQLSAQFIPDSDSPMAPSPVRYSEISVGQAAGSQKQQSRLSLNAPQAATPDIPVRLESSVSPDNVSGEVEFYVEGEKIGTAPVVNGTAIVTWTPQRTGVFALTSKFLPSSAHLPSESAPAYVTVFTGQAIIQSVKVEDRATAFSPVRVTAVVLQPDAQGVVRFFLGRNPDTNVAPSADGKDKTVVDVPVKDSVATTADAFFAQTGDTVPVYAVFIPTANSKYARSEAKVTYAQVVAPPQKAPQAGAVAFDDISLNLSTTDRIYRQGEEIRVKVHLENNESFINGFTYVNEIGIYAPKGFEFVSASGRDISGSVKAAESLVDTTNPRYTGFKLSKPSVPSNSFVNSGYRDFTVTYRITDEAVSGTPNYFQAAVNLYGGGDANSQGETTSVGKAIQVISEIAGAFAGATWGKLIKTTGQAIGGVIKGRKRTTVGPRTADDMPITIAGTSGTGNPNPPIADLNGSSGSSNMPLWAEVLLTVGASLGLLFGIGSVIFNIFQTQFPNLPQFPKF